MSTHKTKAAQARQAEKVRLAYCEECYFCGELCQQTGTGKDRNGFTIAIGVCKTCQVDL